MRNKITELLGADKAKSLLDFNSPAVSKADIHLPGKDHVDEQWVLSNRNPQTLRSLQQLFDTGRMGGTGYIGILPVDQGLEHTAGSSFSPILYTSIQREFLISL